MLNNLFSSFDSKNFIFFSFLFLNLYMFFFFFLSKKINSLLIFMKKIFFFLDKNICSGNIFKSVFILIFSFNFFSLNMYSFGLTSQISLNIFLIFSLWFPLFILNLTKLNNSFFIHLLPLSTSLFLIPMMILIEFMSFFIRPLTLFLRLSINMIAGHVLVSLISSMILSQNFFFIFLMYPYMLMKFLVSFIQSYIIVTLLNLYIEEI
uniref:ATP synthase subunit a n=1 Tax=Tetranychus phaselus TaxID=381747 RepID=A0A075X8B2_TETPE|nr:ATP synthase F0 subunit 6 [Tetranychus phaselus]AIH15682.1 ATP synthase F0 subunit 6 [Tetranychus phaselus]